MTRMLGALITAILVLCGLASSVQAAVSVPAGAAAIYTYDAPIYDAPGDDSVQERGPPTAPRPIVSSTRLITTYAYPATLVQVARPTTTTGSQVRAAHGDLSSRQRAGVAANTGVAAIEASPRVAPWAGNSLSRLSSEGETMYRVWGGGADQAGSWLTPIKPVSSAAAREGLALPAENAATYVSRVTLPPGVRMQVGTAAPAFGQSGGRAQAQLLERIPLSSFGKGELLP